MSGKPFPTIIPERREGEKPLTEQLLADFHGRDESLLSVPLDARFEEATRSVSGFALGPAEFPVWIPAAVETADGDVEIVLVFEAFVSTGTGQVRARLGGAGTFIVADVTATSYSRTEIRLPSADVKANAGDEVSVRIEISPPASGSITIRNVWGAASRFERLSDA